MMTDYWTTLENELIIEKDALEGALRYSKKILKTYLGDKNKLKRQRRKMQNDLKIVKKRLKPSGKEIYTNDGN